MNKLKLFIFIISIGNFAYAQTPSLITEGIIEFDKKINKYAFIEKTLQQYTSNTMRESYLKYKSTHPQFLILKSTLSFSENKTIFTPLPDLTEQSEHTWNGQPIAEQINTIYTDFSTNNYTMEKKIYSDMFLVKDSLRKITWKITNETREIAGYICRRANGLIMDSVYVVAFFTNKIPIQGGPESFNGLPGMILGVAVPDENMTWFATKIIPRHILPNEMAPPSKGKTVSYKQLYDTLVTTFKSYDDYGRHIIKSLLL